MWRSRRTYGSCKIDNNIFFLNVVGGQSQGFAVELSENTGVLIVGMRLLCYQRSHFYSCHYRHPEIGLRLYLAKGTDITVPEVSPRSLKRGHWGKMYPLTYLYPLKPVFPGLEASAGSI